MPENYPIDFGEYRLLRKLAQGGMAEIFLAQNGQGKICAVKRILPHLAHEESFIRMFIDEARIVSHLKHPNVAGVYDQGKTNGYYYIAMEFVQGHSLLAVTDRSRQMKAPLARGLLAYVIAELLAGLGCAHEARDAKGRHLGIVHRDVTPQNILISYDGEVKLIDFGVAKARARLTQTEAGFTKGKLSYMSPEQARGEDLDSRSDLFSIGIVLFEITTNTRLFNKEGPGGILGAIVNDPIPTPSSRVKGYPRELEEIVMRALEKDVDYRWQSADEMREALFRYARKEKPAPGPQRLKDLIHDLFGKPDSQKVIEAARSGLASEATPDRVESHSTANMLRGASLRVKGHEVPLDQPPAERVVGHRSLVGGSPSKQDETRMFQPEAHSHKSRAQVPRLDATNFGTPVVELALERDDVPVPEPEVPARLAAARFLARLGETARHMYRAHRARVVLGVASAIALIGLGVAFRLGAIGGLADAVGEAAERAKELKRSAGLDSKGVEVKGAPTVLRLISDPPGATIAVNGIGVGAVTPQSLPELPLGQPLEIELTLPGYRPRTEQVTLWSNQGAQEISVKLERRRGSIAIDSDPPGAEVTVNGTPQSGRTPLKIDDLPADEPVKLVISKEGRVSKTISETPGDREERKVTVTLPVDQMSIPPGRISVTTSAASCHVLIDGQSVGAAPIQEHRVRPGPHQVKALCPNYAPETRDVSVASGRTVNVSLNLAPSVFGYLSIEPVPAEGSIVEINGKRVQMPVSFLKVVPGRHVIVVLNEGLRRRREETINVAPNDRVTRTINLIQ